MMRRFSSSLVSASRTKPCCAFVIAGEPRLLGLDRPPECAGRGWLRYIFARAHSAYPIARVLPCLQRSNRRAPAPGVISAAVPNTRGPRALVLTPLELLDQIAALVPPPRVHRHR